MFILSMVGSAPGTGGGQGKGRAADPLGQHPATASSFFNLWMRPLAVSGLFAWGDEG